MFDCPRQIKGIRRRAATGLRCTAVISCGGGVWSLWSVSHAAPRPLLKRIKKSVSYSIDSKKSVYRYRPNFFSLRVINRWNSLSQEIVDAPSVNAFKRHLESVRQKKMGNFMDSQSAQPFWLLVMQDTMLFVFAIWWLLEGSAMI